MSARFVVFAAATAAVLLTGCVDRSVADATLAKGCEAGVNAMLTDGLKIGTISSTEFSPSPEGQGYRRVTMKAVATDGWAEEEREFICVFEESFGFMNSNHNAAIYQLRLSEEQIYGKSGREIMGDAQDFIKLTDAIRAAMYQ